MTKKQFIEHVQFVTTCPDIRQIIIGYRLFNAIAYIGYTIKREHTQLIKTTKK